MLKEPGAYIGDGGSIAVIAGVWLQALPQLAALLSVVWVCLRILDTRVAKTALRRWFGIDMEKWHERERDEDQH